MALALFDLDNTLLAGDSDYLWAQYLIEKNIIDADYYQAKNDEFFSQYKQGTLDIFEFLEFQLTPLTQHPIEQLQSWHTSYMEQKIKPLISQASRDLIQHHRQQGHRLVIITATNRFITAPIAKELGIEDLLATEIEQIDGRFTGNVVGTPCFQQGKVTRLQQWLAVENIKLEQSWFYSDSHNDLPLLEQVSTAVAVNPDPKLHSIAKQKNWPIIDLHNVASN